jgi:two-component system, OmpR family, sensor histidine kinase VicK
LTPNSDYGRSTRSSTESTKIFYGVDIIVSTILQILNHTNTIHVCVDQTTPSLMTEMDVLKEGFVAAKKRGVKLRCITEITKSNLSYCKQMLTMVDELRHLDGIKSNLYLNDIGCLSPATIHEKGVPASKGIYSDIKEVVEHQLCLFETLWNVSVPGEQRIEQLDEGIEHEFFQVISNQKKVSQVFTHIVESMENEALILIPTDRIMIGLDKLGIIKNIIKTSMEKEATIKIICPVSEKNIKIINKINEEAPSIKILNAENNSLFCMCIIDRIKILGIEVRHSDTDSFSKAIDFALYSNRKLAVNSFRSIFDILWNERVLNEKLKANDKAQKDFINIAAHELRTPIQPIIGLSEVLRQRKLEGQLQQDKILDTIIRNAKRVQNLSEDLLDVARIESNSLSLKKEKFNLNQLILNAITDSRNYIASENMSSNNNNINIEPIFKEKVDIYLEADKNRINQVILNLLVNAIRFTKKGTITITIETKEREYDDVGDKVVVIAIKDSGTGIAAKIFPKLFTKFASVSQGGTGLGLFISKNIIEAHGGRMWAENNQNDNGATFSFSLPTATHANNDISRVPYRQRQW